MKKVVHFSSVHGRYDIRVFLKECVTLASNGYDVTYIISDGLGDEVKDGVKIVDLGLPEYRRLKRMFLKTFSFYKYLLSLDADVFHFHDPELIPYGLLLKRNKPNSVVIFDSHENYADDISEKVYIPTILRRVVSSVYKYFEHQAVKRFDAIISATPSIDAHFKKQNALGVDINNYPFLSEFLNSNMEFKKKYDVVYIGAISEIRGVHFLVDSLSMGNKKSLAIAGTFANSEIEARVKSSTGWDSVTYLGQVGRKEIAELLASSKVAAVTFLPAPNHVESQPNKMFEYMSASLPVIGSNFPLWKEIIEGNHCGVCVDPSSPADMSSTLDSLLCDHQRLKSMAENARVAIQEKYNWEAESIKLLSFYQGLFADV